MKIGKLSVIIGALTIVLLGVLIVWDYRMTGVPKSRIRRDAWKRQELGGSWQAVQAGSGAVYAILFYNEERSRCRYCVYLSHDDVAYGYVYRDGGEDNYIMDAVRCLVYEDRGIVLLSLNRDRVCRIETKKAADRQSIRIDPERPFAAVLPVGNAEITLYDAQDRIVPVYDTFR